MGFRRPCSTYTDFVLNFQLLLDNAHFLVSPKVDFVFSLGFKVCELKTLLIIRQHAGYSALLCLEQKHGMDGASPCV